MGAQKLNYATFALSAVTIFVVVATADVVTLSIEPNDDNRVNEIWGDSSEDNISYEPEYDRFQYNFGVPIIISRPATRNDVPKKQIEKRRSRETVLRQMQWLQSRLPLKKVEFFPDDDDRRIRRSR